MPATALPPLTRNPALGRMAGPDELSLPLLPLLLLLRPRKRPSKKLPPAALLPTVVPVPDTAEAIPAFAGCRFPHACIGGSGTVRVSLRTLQQLQ